jgi:hypothetical protein
LLELEVQRASLCVLANVMASSTERLAVVNLSSVLLS